MSKDAASVDGRSFRSWEDIISETMLTESQELEANERIDNVGKREMPHLELFKSIFLLLLLVATVLISWTVYTTLRQTEKILKFEKPIIKIKRPDYSKFSLRFSNAIEDLHSFDVSITSHGDSMNLKWSYALVPDFDFRAAECLSVTQWIPT